MLDLQINIVMRREKVSGKLWSLLSIILVSIQNDSCYFGGSVVELCVCSWTGELSRWRMVGFQWKVLISSMIVPKRQAIPLIEYEMLEHPIFTQKLSWDLFWVMFCCFPHRWTWGSSEEDLHKVGEFPLGSCVLPDYRPVHWPSRWEDAHQTPGSAFRREACKCSSLSIGGVGLGWGFVNP